MFKQLTDYFFGTTIPNSIVVYDARFDEYKLSSQEQMEHLKSVLEFTDAYITPRSFYPGCDLYFNNEKLGRYLQDMIDCYLGYEEASKHSDACVLGKPAFILIQNYGVTFYVDPRQDKING